VDRPGQRDDSKGTKHERSGWSSLTVARVSCENLAHVAASRMSPRRKIPVFVEKSGDVPDLHVSMT
jgi:hypothetical protein